MGNCQSLQSLPDFGSCLTAWVTENIVYGLFLSDHTILDQVETEIVVLSGIMSQNLHAETSWHLRGMRRIGMTRDAVEKIHECVSQNLVVLKLDPMLTMTQRFDWLAKSSIFPLIECRPS